MTVILDLHELNDFARMLRKAEPEIAKELNTSLKKAGDIVANAARVRSSFSGNIPGTIKVRRSNLTVRVDAGGAGEPHPGESAAFEHGGEPGSFRHPVFGNRDNWVSQQAHPFLIPALDAEAGRVEQAVADAIGVVLDRLF